MSQITTGRDYKEAIGEVHLKKCNLMSLALDSMFMVFRSAVLGTNV